MSECDRIADQIEKAFRGGAWHGPAVLELLEGVDAAAASARPVTGAHSIWELTRHIAAWKGVVTRRIAGAPAVRVPDAENWPQIVDTSDEAWAAALADLTAAHAALVAGARSVSDEQLGRATAGSEDSPFQLLHGAAQHDAYHAGQIALLRVAARG